MIDYVIGNEKVIEEIKIIEEGIKTESDHVPLEVELTGQQRKKRKNRNKVIEIERSDWTEEGVKKYQENCIGWKSMQNETEGIWKEIKEKIRSITKNKRKIISWSLGKKVWHNKDWKKKNRELRKVLKDLKKENINRKEYIAKWKYKEWCKEQKKIHEEIEEDKIRNIKNETAAWKLINKSRKE